LTCERNFLHISPHQTKADGAEALEEQSWGGGGGREFRRNKSNCHPYEIKGLAGEEQAP
jgi:hypothetical protein